MSLKVTIVGAQDKEIEAMLRESGMVPRFVPFAGLTSMVNPPDVVLLDLRGHSSVPPGLAALRRQHTETGVVILTKSLDLELVLAAMRAGANECVAEPLSRPDLEAAITRVVAHQSGPTTSRSFAIVGVKGGVGATSLAVNVAAVLARVATANALLIDLHVSRGDAALHLGIEPRFSVVDALDNLQKLDDAYFRTLVTKTASGLTLLAAPGAPSAARLDPARVRTLIDFTSKRFEYTVLDVPRTEPGALEALDGVTKIVLVTTQELSAVRSAAQMLAQLGQRHGPDKLLVVMSRLDHESDISHQDVEKVLGTAIANSFPSDYRRMVAALHKGRPVVLDNHSGLASSWEKFAHSLAGLKLEQRTGRGTSSWLARLSGRK